MKINILSTLIGVLITAMFSIGFYYFTNKTPKLTYDLSPVTNFSNEEKSISIFTCQIENSGNKEAENIQLLVKFDGKISAYKVNQSNQGISYSVNIDTNKNNYSFLFPFLNPGENCKFSFLIEKSSLTNPIISLRAKGIEGAARTIESEKY